MSLIRFIWLILLSIVLTRSTQALEEPKQRKVCFEISSYRDQELRLQFVILRHWPSNIEELWVCYTDFDLKRVSEELRLHRQCGKTSSLLKSYCNKTICSVKKLEITEITDNAKTIIQYPTIFEIVDASFDKKDIVTEMHVSGMGRFVYTQYIETKQEAIIKYIFMFLHTIIFGTLLVKLEQMFFPSSEQQKDYKTPVIPPSVAYRKKHNVEECFLIEQSVGLLHCSDNRRNCQGRVLASSSLNNIKTYKTNIDSTGVRVTKSSTDHDGIHTDQTSIDTNHESYTSKKNYLPDENDIYTNQTSIGTSPETSISRKPYSPNQDDVYTNHTILMRGKSHSTRELFTTNQCNELPRNSDHHSKEDNPRSSLLSTLAPVTNSFYELTEFDNPSQRSTSSIIDQFIQNDQRNQISNEYNKKIFSLKKVDSCADSMAPFNNFGNDSVYSSQRYQSGTIQMDELTQVVDPNAMEANTRTSLISYDQASCGLNSDRQLTSASQDSLSSSRGDNQSTCSSSLSFRTASLRSFPDFSDNDTVSGVSYTTSSSLSFRTASLRSFPDFSDNETVSGASYTTSSADSGYQDESTEAGEVLLGEQGDLDARFNREVM